MDAHIRSAPPVKHVQNRSESTSSRSSFSYLKNFLSCGGDRGHISRQPCTDDSLCRADVNDEMPVFGGKRPGFKSCHPSDFKVCVGRGQAWLEEGSWSAAQPQRLSCCCAQSGLSADPEEEPTTPLSLTSSKLSLFALARSSCFPPPSPCDSSGSCSPSLEGASPLPGSAFPFGRGSGGSLAVASGYTARSKHRGRR